MTRPLQRFVLDQEQDLPPGTARVVAIALLRSDGAALMQLRDDKPGLSYANMWVLPGGHAHEGEPIETAARREFHEETGYTLGDLHRAVCFYDRPAGYTLMFVVVFWGLYDGRQPLDCHEGQAVEFLRRNEVPVRPVPDVLVRAWDATVESARARGSLAAASPQCPPVATRAGAERWLRLLRHVSERSR